MKSTVNEVYAMNMCVELFLIKKKSGNDNTKLPNVL